MQAGKTCNKGECYVNDLVVVRKVIVGVVVWRQINWGGVGVDSFSKLFTGLKVRNVFATQWNGIAWFRSMRLPLANSWLIFSSKPFTANSTSLRSRCRWLRDMDSIKSDLVRLLSGRVLSVIPIYLTSGPSLAALCSSS